ncbi:hypothetical protein BJV74DRAFT_339188 [Russula compacta]|nr:hypothetical protein BJV74DRAFT_339188 [Russula compacta]
MVPGFVSISCSLAAIADLSAPATCWAVGGVVEAWEYWTWWSCFLPPFLYIGPTCFRDRFPFPSRKNRRPYLQSSNMLASNEPPTNLLFDYPGADFIIRSNDTHHFRVPKCYIVNSSPALAELIGKALIPADVADVEPSSLPVVQLPESGAILHSLLTFVFPVTPIIPSTTETTMELLSVAQKYQMSTVLAHIRSIVARESQLSALPETSFYTYALAQKYGLRQEALQAAQIAILNYPMTIEDLDDRLDVVPGASLYELWKYHESVRAILASDLKEFRASGARGTLTGLRCGGFSSSTLISNIPAGLMITSSPSQELLTSSIPLNSTLP